MAHMIDESTGKAAIAYIGAKPWHGLGQPLTEGASIETWQEEAGMDWEIVRTPVTFGPKHQIYPERDVLLRDDTYAPLSIVSKDYIEVQPRAMLEFFRDLTKVAGFKLETAGCLNGGRRQWALARVNEKAFIGNKDEVRAFLLLAGSCDKSMETIGQFVAERVVCANTMRIALGEKGGGKVKTNHRTVFDAKSVKEQLGLFSKSWSTFIADAKLLAATKVTTKAQVKKFMCQVFGGDMKLPLDEQPKKYAMLESYRLAGDSPGSDLASAKGTAWGLVNGVTRFVDFEMRARSDNNRLDNAWFGRGADFKDKAMAAALELAAK